MEPTKNEQIRQALENLCTCNFDIDACMVVRQGFDGIILFPDDFTDKVSTIWTPIKETLDSMLETISKGCSYGIEKTYVELLGYAAVFCTLGQSDTSLIAFMGSRGADLFEVASSNLKEILKTKQRIEDIIED